ncbi:MAG: hypothetical protein ACI4WY_12220 [Anaerovoracaceae bacterium]
MLEKLIYKNSLVRDWSFDVTMCREAEAFIRQMAAQGYRLKKLTRDYRALFVKDEEIQEKVFAVTVPSDRVKGREAALRTALTGQGWEKIAEKDGLEVYQADARQQPEPVPEKTEVGPGLPEPTLMRPEIPQRETKIRYEDVRDQTRFGSEAVCAGVMAVCFAYQGISRMKYAAMMEQAGFLASAGEQRQPVIFFAFAALMVMTMILNVAAARNLRHRLDVDREKKPFLPRTMMRMQNWMAAVFGLGMIVLVTAAGMFSPVQGLGILLSFMVLLWVVNDSNLLLPQGMEWVPALLMVIVLLAAVVCMV